MSWASEGGASLMVAAACSGLTAILTLLPIAVLVAYLSPLSSARRVALVAIVLPIAMAANLLRVVFTRAGRAGLGRRHRDGRSVAHPRWPADLRDFVSLSLGDGAGSAPAPCVLHHALRAPAFGWNTTSHEVTQIAWRLTARSSLLESARDMLHTMRLPRLFRRRELWLPTAWGWALLVALAAGGSWLGLHALYDFLAPTEPVGRGLLVVEGWVDESGLEKAARLWQAGGYAGLVTTGGPVDRYASLLPFATYAEQAAAILRTQGIADRDIAVVPAPASARDRTFASAVALREWISSRGVDAPALDIVSEGPHARRTWHLYRMAFGEGVAIGIRSVASDRYPPSEWWKSSAGAKDVLTEAIAWAWVACFFHPPQPGSYEKTSEPAQELPVVSASAVAVRLREQKGGADASIFGLRSR